MDPLIDRVRAPVGLRDKLFTRALPQCTPEHSSAIGPFPRRDGRVDECAGLENRFTGNGNVGSNPTPSATNLVHISGFELGSTPLASSATMPICEAVNTQATK